MLLNLDGAGWYVVWILCSLWWRLVSLFLMKLPYYLKKLWPVLYFAKYKTKKKKKNYDQLIGCCNFVDVLTQEQSLPSEYCILLSWFIKSFVDYHEQQISSHKRITSAVLKNKYLFVVNNVIVALFVFYLTLHLYFGSWTYSKSYDSSVYPYIIIGRIWYCSHNHIQMRSNCAINFLNIYIYIYI